MPLIITTPMSLIISLVSPMPAAMGTMATGIGETNEMMSDMGIVMISGMVISTVVTLVFTPVFYSVIDELSHVFRRRKKKVLPRTEEEPAPAGV